MQTVMQCLCSVLAIGCANVKYTTVEDQPASKERAVSAKDRINVEYFGTSDGARNLLDAANRRRESQTAGEVAKDAVKKGLPTSFTGNDQQVSVNASGYYGYGGYGMYGQGGLYTSTLLAAEAMTFGYGHTGLPRLTEPPVSFLPTSILPSAVEGAQVPCPRDRRAITNQERLACLEQDRDQIARRLDKQK